MYQFIYDFVKTHIFNNVSLSAYHNTISGVDTSLDVWLSHTTTIIVMCLFVTCLVLLIRWVFRLVSSAFLLR